MNRVGQNHINSVHTVFLAGKSPNVKSYTVYVYGSGQPQPYYRTPYIWCIHIRYFWQVICQIYSHIRCIHTVLANPNHITVHHIYGVYTYGIFGREIAKYIVIYGVYIRFWPTPTILPYTIYMVYTHTVFLAGKLPNIQSYTVYIYGSGQPQPYYRTPYIWCIHIR